MVVDVLLRFLKLKYSLPGVKRRSSVSLKALPRDHTEIGTHRQKTGSLFSICSVLCMNLYELLFAGSVTAK